MVATHPTMSMGLNKLLRNIAIIIYNILYIFLVFEISLAYFSVNDHLSPDCSQRQSIWPVAAGLTFLTGQEILNRNISDLRKATWLETLRKINSGKAETQETSESEIPTDPNMLKIGFVGHTNVGKSSIMNTLVGEKHFSMSIRPGHTKELQTWNVHPMVQLVDSPGIIFPSKVPRQLQILSGLFPVDQVREPYSVVGEILSYCEIFNHIL